MENNSVYCNQLLVDCFQANNSTQINKPFKSAVGKLLSHFQRWEA
jgi:hypothetical protein